MNLKNTQVLDPGELLVVAKTRRHALQLDNTFRFNMLLFYLSEFM